MGSTPREKGQKSRKRPKIDPLPSPASEPASVPASEAASEEWVDLILEPTTGIRAVKASPQAVSSDPDPEPEPELIPIPRPRTTRRPPAKAVQTATAAKPASASGAQPVITTGTRWWIIAPALLLLAAVAYVNRPVARHDRLPSAVLGSWKTDFWMFENQTLQLLPDTVVLKLNEPQEGRYPITTIDVRGAGPEQAITLSYRTADGAEKTLDFVADNEPATALRFRAHSGLIWTRLSP